MANIIHKPNQLITCSNNNITVTQRKIYNKLLQSLERELVKGDKETIKFNVNGLVKELGLGNFSTEQLKEQIIKLSDIRIEIFRSPVDWKIFHLISNVERKEDLLEIDFPRPLRKAILNGNFYTAIDIDALIPFKSKFSVIFYEWYNRYKNIQLPEIEVTEFKKLMGIENAKTYNKNFGILKQKVIDKFIKELKVIHQLDIKLETTKQGRSIKYLKFTVKDKSEPVRKKIKKKTFLENIEAKKQREIIEANEKAKKKEITTKELIEKNRKDREAPKQLSKLETLKGEIARWCFKNRKLKLSEELENITTQKSLDEFINKYQIKF